MSLSKFGRSWRGRLPWAATVVLLTGALVAAPQVSNAKNPAAVKQFIVQPPSIVKVSGNTYTETVTNCGGPLLPPGCTVSSTIGLGTVYIAVPSPFDIITPVPSPVTSPDGHNWVVSYNTTTRQIQAFANTGSDKLQAGQSITFTFSVALLNNICPLGDSTFTTSAWGSNSASNSDPFTPKSDQPTLHIADCPGASGTDVTGSGFGGVVNVTFTGDDILAACQALSDPLGPYHMPDLVNFDGSGSTGSPKRFTFTFPAQPRQPNGPFIGYVDSSWYRVCIASTFSWPGGTFDPTTGFYVGILSSCYIPDSNTLLSQTPPRPCVTQQYATLPDQNGNYSIVITVLDPLDTKFH